MKTGIITFHFAHNYGAMLQAYALMSCLEELGHEVEIINYIPKKLDKEYSINPFTHINKPKYFIKQAIKFPIRLRQYSIFNEFLNEKMKLSKKVETQLELQQISREFDNIIVGSDQVWNDNITGEINTYFLDFAGENTKKISYAASFGKSEASEFIKKSIKKNLPLFYKTSVREDKGLEIINNEVNVKAIQVCDPVFLLESEEWAKKINNEKYSDEKYILYYSLQDNKELESYSEEISKKMGLPIFSIHPLCKTQKVKGKQLFNVGPIEFLDLIKNAEVVCTNSFHAVAFSVIFKKKLIHVAHSKLSSRVESLLKMLDVQVNDYSKCINDIMIYPDMINYDNLTKFKVQSINYLMDGGVKNNEVNRKHI